MANDPQDYHPGDRPQPDGPDPSSDGAPAGQAPAPPARPAPAQRPAPTADHPADADTPPVKAVGTTGLAEFRLKIGSLRDRPGEPKPLTRPSGQPDAERETDRITDPSPPAAAELPVEPVSAPERIRPPSVRDRLPPELEQEVEAALGDMSLDQLMEGSAAEAGEGEIPPQTQLVGRVVAVARDEVFLELGGRNQGVLPARQLETLPESGTTLEVVVRRFDPEDGLYEVSLPGAVAEVGDWTDVAEGLVVEATVTGHNKGGLECQVGSMRAFMPISQVALYRVEDAEEYVGQKLACIVTQADPMRRNLVLSRRAVLEREQAEAKRRLWDELKVGQTREGIVRSLKDFGAFVDLGGVDGLIHVSQLSWDRIDHPSEVLEVGQKVQVKIAKIDQQTGKVALCYRDLTDSPWTHAARAYPVKSCVQGVVTKIMDFGALVKLEPGIAGLIHVSELSHGRVWRVSDVVQVGQEVDVQVISVDAAKQRIGLSLKALAAPPPSEKESQHRDQLPSGPVAADAAERPPAAPEDLKGGVDRRTGGERFGLQW